jgi:NADH:ubiquinone oxidoreductase subunit F (NADH-binding)
MNIVNKIKKYALVGRGGACFPVAIKWEAVKKAAGEKKYVVCNATEGEPGVKKDLFILENYPEKVVAGIKLAMDFIEASEGIIYLNYQYDKKVGKKLEAAIGDLPISVFLKPVEAGYIGGEETALLNAIEGKRVEPRLRPPYPTEVGLWGCPTLVNNVETFYNVSLADSDDYAGKRFYTVSGDCLNEGVYNLPDNFTIEKILKETDNYPKFPFFVQIGGDASGEVLNSKQLKRQVSGAASITVYSIKKYSFEKIMKKWLEFSANESCGQCTPCREGTYRLLEIINSDKKDWQLFSELLSNLKDSAFCSLGCAVPTPIKSFIKNVMPQIPGRQLKLKDQDASNICRCFSAD